ncbi:MAG: hypothetical protein M1830_001579 [Pleopsidium flavum]|nr:MAG: hypothetical protein M1830_001579 [Pleopsidium flavum]
MTSLGLYILTFNCAREFIKPAVFASHVFDARPSIQSNTSPPPDILVLSLQELAPIAYSFLGGSYLVPYFDRFRYAIQLAASRTGNGDAKYTNIITRNLGMTAIMVFVRQDHVAAIQQIETAGVGVGLLGMGNKGAVGVRLGYSIGASDSEAVGLTFIAAHLAPMEAALERRNEDWENIVRRLVFTPVGQEATRTATQPRRGQGDEAPLLPGPTDNSTMPTSGLYSPTSHLFVAGDLNYRTSKIKPRSDDYQAYPQPTKDTTDPRHYSHLFKDDQLLRELKAGRTCHGLIEQPISFPPTYKYSDEQRAVAETNNQGRWDWAKHRWPSWCDRVLYLDLPTWMQESLPSASIKTHGYAALPLLSTSDHRPVALSCSLPLNAIPPPTGEPIPADVRLIPPFDVDPDWREKRAWARRREIIVGIVLYLSLTWEGNGFLLATIIGSVGGWMVIRSLLAF